MSNSLFKKMRIAGFRRQAGMTMFGWLATLILLAFVVNIGMKLAPHYMEHRTVVTVVESISPEVWRGTSTKKMYEAVKKGFKVNNVRGLKPKDILQIERTQTLTKVILDYEARENLFANVDGVLVFNKVYEY